MARPLSMFLALAPALALIFAPDLAPDAHAGGALSKLIGGMKKKAGQGDSGRRADQSDDDSSSDDSDDSWGDDRYHDNRWGDADPGVIPIGLYAGPYPTAAQGGDVAVYAALQNVRDSTGSASLRLMSSYGPIGITVANTRYYEREAVAMGEGDLITLDLWSIGGAYRVAALEPGGRTAVWLRGGVAGAAADGLSVVGASVGAHVARNFTGSLGAEAEARALVLQHDIRGFEGRAGIAASFLRVSYRALALNAGPVLHGPEVGISLGF